MRSFEELISTLTFVAAGKLNKNQVSTDVDSNTIKTAIFNNPYTKENINTSDGLLYRQTI